MVSDIEFAELVIADDTAYSLDTIFENKSETMLSAASKVSHEGNNIA